MKPIKQIVTLLVISVFISCSNSEKCKDQVEKTYYGKSNLRTKTLKDCDGNLKSYEHLQVDCKNCSGKIIYSHDGSPDSLLGKAWIHVIWNSGMNFNMGDTLDITVEVMDPPNLESEFRITDNDGNSTFTRLDSMEARWNDRMESATFIEGTFYNYRTVIDDSTEFFEMENTFSYEGQPWKTAKRHQKYFELK